MEDNLLDFRIPENVELISATLIQRFINWVTDIIFFIIVCFALEIVGIPISFIVMSSSWWILLIMLFTYFVVIEIVMNGRSVGKYFTKTRVVTEHGYRPELTVFLIRAIGRMIPLTTVNLLFGKRTYYDIYTKTYVIDEKLSKL